MPVTTAAIVCAHRMDRLALTTRCVRSVLDGDRQPDELLVVVDNNEELRQVLERTLGPEGIRVLANPGSGAASARSAAVAETSADLCAFIDDDAWAEPSWLSNLASAFDSPGVAGAGGKVLPEWAKGANPLPPELLWIVGSTYRGHPEGEVAITRPIGANMAARTEVIRHLGGFPAGFGPRGGKKVSSNEELALYGAITRLHGPESVVYVPASVVHHHVPAERTSWRYLLSRCWAEGTSKADVRAAFDGSVMEHDRKYARVILVPAIGGYLWRGISSSDRGGIVDGAKCAVALAVTSSGYLLRQGRSAWERVNSTSREP